jgi:hypothetical protein
MKKSIIILFSVVGGFLILFGGFALYGFFAVEDPGDIAQVQAQLEAKEALEEMESSKNKEMLDVKYDPNDSIKGEYGPDTVTINGGKGIDYAEIKKAEYSSPKEFIHDVNNILNEKGKGQWSSAFEKEQYYAGVIIVYINHFVRNGMVSGEMVEQLKGLQDVARKVHDSKDQEEAKQYIETMKTKIAQINI